MREQPHFPEMLPRAPLSPDNKSCCFEFLQVFSTCYLGFGDLLLAGAYCIIGKHIFAFPLDFSIFFSLSIHFPYFLTHGFALVLSSPSNFFDTFRKLTAASAEVCPQSRRKGTV